MSKNAKIQENTVFSSWYFQQYGQVFPRKQDFLFRVPGLWLLSRLPAKALASTTASLKGWKWLDKLCCPLTYQVGALQQAAHGVGKRTPRGAQARLTAVVSYGSSFVHQEYVTLGRSRTKWYLVTWYLVPGRQVRCLPPSPIPAMRHTIPPIKRYRPSSSKNQKKKKKGTKTLLSPG